MDNAATVIPLGNKASYTGVRQIAIKFEFNSWDKRLRVPIFNDMQILYGCLPSKSKILVL